MCSSLVLNDPDLLGKDPQPVRLGGKIEITTKDGKTHEARWNGFSQKESLSEKFFSNNWQSCDIIGINSYREQGRDFEVHAGYVISGVCLDIPGRGLIVNLTTRKSRGKEQEVHNRWPITIKKRY